MSTTGTLTEPRPLEALTMLDLAVLELTSHPDDEFTVGCIETVLYGYGWRADRRYLRKALDLVIKHGAVRVVSGERMVIGDGYARVPDVLNTCASDSDGHCTHALCPQLWDNEPGKTGRSCPLYDWEDRE